MNAQQMQELCRELVDTCKMALITFPCANEYEEARKILRAAISKAEHAFNPTPNTNGCVETAATVPAFAGTGETVKALGVGPVDKVAQ